MNDSFILNFLNFKGIEDYTLVKSDEVDCYMCEHKLAQKKFNDNIFDIGSTSGLPEYNGTVYTSTTNQEFQPLVYTYYSDDSISRFLISQDFILYYKLISDIKDNKIITYYKINENGEKEDVIIIHNDCYQIKTSYIKDFLRVTNKSLLFDIEIRIKDNEDIGGITEKLEDKGIIVLNNNSVLNFRYIFNEY